MDANDYRYEFEAQQELRAKNLSDTEFLIKDFRGIIRRNTNDKAERKKLHSLIKDIQLAGKWGDTFRAALFSYQLGCEVMRIVLEKHHSSTGAKRLATIREKASARGIARKHQVMAETLEFAGKVFPIAFEIAEKNPKRGRVGIVEEVVKQMAVRKKRNPRVVYELIKCRLPPREK